MASTPTIKIDIYHTDGCWTRGPCAICGSIVKDTPAPWGGGGILAASGGHHVNIHLCRQCLQIRDFDKRLEDHARRLEEQARQTRELLGRLDVPPYEKWLEMLSFCEQEVFGNAVPYDIGINAYGSLYNPNNYPEEIVRAALPTDDYPDEVVRAARAVLEAMYEINRSHHHARASQR
jgi:hypothetical protein